MQLAGSSESSHLDAVVDELFAGAQDASDLHFERLSLRPQRESSAEAGRSPPVAKPAPPPHAALLPCRPGGSFADLPREIRLQILASCDWPTLYRTAATCRSNRALVRWLVRCPYFNTDVEEQPAILTTEFETEEEQERACQAWADRLVAKLGGRGKPDLCLLFASCSHPNLQPMLRALRARLSACCVVAGAVAPGVVGSDSQAGGRGREVDLQEGDLEEAALSAAFIHLPPGTQLHTCYTKHGLQPGAVMRPGGGGPQALLGSLPDPSEALPGGQRRTWIVLSDTHSYIRAVLATINQAYPGDAVVGGMGGTADNGPALLVSLPDCPPGHVACAGLASGTLCICISGPQVSAEPLVCRGMQRISPRYIVQTVCSSVDLSPVGKVTLVQSLQSCVKMQSQSKGSTWVPTGPTLTPTAALVQALQEQGVRVPPRAPLFLGVRPLLPDLQASPDGDERMTMLQMHDPNNLMRTSGFVSVQYPVVRGMMAAYFTPLPLLAASQLRSRLEAAVTQLHSVEELMTHMHDATAPLQGRTSSASLPEASSQLVPLLSEEAQPVYGALCFPCVAKGQLFYAGARDVEATLLDEVLPGVPQVGMFANGEIGPTPADELAPEGSPAADLLGYSTALCLLRMTAPLSAPEAAAL